MVRCGRWSGSSLLQEDLAGRVVAIMIFWKMYINTHD